MLKKRIIPVQLLMDGRLVKTQNFSLPRDVGDPVKSSQVYNSQYADELIFLNISRKDRKIEPLAQLLGAVSKVTFMPLAVGGGIQTVEDVAFLIKHGADKVVLNSICFRNPNLISQVSAAFGAQAIVISIDVRWIETENRYRLYSDCGQIEEDATLEDHIALVTTLGAGEIFIQSIDRDGTMTGYDLDLLVRTQAISKIPVIGCGGSGSYDHLLQVFKATDISALACGSLFNFSDSNPMRAKNFLTNYSIPLKIV